MAQTDKGTKATSAAAQAAGDAKPNETARLTDQPNADAVDTGAGDDELVRIDPAGNWRPASVARAGRHPGAMPSLSKDDLKALQDEMKELQDRMVQIEAVIGPAAPRRTFMMSEGVRQDVELHGHAVDPGTGEAFTTDDLDRIGQERR